MWRRHEVLPFLLYLEGCWIQRVPESCTPIPSTFLCLSQLQSEDAQRCRLSWPGQFWWWWWGAFKEGDREGENIGEVVSEEKFEKNKGFAQLPASSAGHWHCKSLLSDMGPLSPPVLFWRTDPGGPLPMMPVGSAPASPASSAFWDLSSTDCPSLSPAAQEELRAWTRKVSHERWPLMLYPGMKLLWTPDPEQETQQRQDRLLSRRNHTFISEGLLQLLKESSLWAPKVAWNL